MNLQYRLGCLGIQRVSRFHGKKSDICLHRTLLVSINVARLVLLDILYLFDFLSRNAKHFKALVSDSQLSCYSPNTFSEAQLDLTLPATLDASQ